MAQEIERKFLVLHDGWRSQVQSHSHMRQGYMSGNQDCSIRVRVSGTEAFLNIKSATLGVSRLEYEYPIPQQDAHELLEKLCTKPLIEKVRHFVPYGRHVWEVDEFVGDNAGLVVAEIELEDETEAFEKPAWCGEEVSHDPRYYNVCLVKHPYSQWLDKR